MAEGAPVQLRRFAEEFLQWLGVTPEELGRAVRAVKDRLEDYYEWCYEYEERGDYYWKGYGDSLSTALRILKKLLSLVGSGGVEVRNIE